MRILIYLLAMLSGFSAAEAARPVSSTSASVDSAVAQAYVAAAALEAVTAFESPVAEAPHARAPLLPAIGIATYVSLSPDTPICRYDIILA
jgi:hypothetical protein